MKFLPLLIFFLFPALAHAVTDHGKYDSQAASHAACKSHTGLSSCEWLNQNPRFFYGAIWETYAPHVGIDPRWNATGGAGSLTSEQHRWEYYPAGCPAGDDIDESGMCVTPPENPCDIGWTPGPGGICMQIDPPEPACRVVLGQVNGVDYCADARDDCAATGGTYGVIMDIAVCIPEEEGPRTCEAGTFVFANEQGDYLCVSADTDPPPEPPVDPNDPDGDGIPNDLDDDDDNDGVLDGADPDQNGDGVADTDTDLDGIPDHEDEDIDNDGVINIVDSDQDGDGAGDCDPTATNYATCIGQTEDVSDSRSDQLVSETNLSGDIAAQEIEAAGIEALGTGESGLTGAGDIADTITGLGFFSPGACSDVTFPMLGSELTVSCAKTQILRDVLAFVVAVWTLFLVFEIAMQRESN